jgi:hypothetical protein
VRVSHSFSSALSTWGYSWGSACPAPSITASGAWGWPPSRSAAARTHGSRRGREAQPRQVGVDAPQSVAIEGRLEARLDLAVVDADAVEDEHRQAFAVLLDVDRHVAQPELHPPKTAPAFSGRERVR